MSLYRTRIALVALIAWLPSTAPIYGDDTMTVEDQHRISATVVQLLRELDSDQFEVRQTAVARLEEMVARPELGGLLSAELKRAILRPDISFEVRWHLQHWLRRLPKAASETAPEVSAEEIERLVQQLDDDAYAVRLGAMQRLEWMLDNPKWVCPLLLRLKERLADPILASDAQGQLELAWKRVRGRWLASDPADWNLPDVSDEQIHEWINRLAQPAPRAEASGRWHVHRVAERELLDLLARDDLLPRVTAALRERLEQTLDADGSARLQTILDMTKPEMVAEYWHNRRHLGEQHLLIGVPMKSPEAANPSHFDRIDERTAHCVSGNSLSPGDYPVGEAFPHPQQEQAFFHLVNLPTPRSRMAYLHSVQTPEAQRLAVLSRRTLDRMLESKRALTEKEAWMLGQLDPLEVSRFAGLYFHLVDDAKLTGPRPHQLVGSPSCFGILCTHLASEGTKEAIPGLTEAIAKQRFLPPTSGSRYRLHWLAALAIAIRDPWPNVDAWLADQIGQTEMLRDYLEQSPELRQQSPEIGATAAGVLLARHGRSPAEFELQSVHDPLTFQLHIHGYRFVSQESKKRVQTWWEQERQTNVSPKTSP